MRNCTYCQSENTDQAKFCTSCGAHFQQIDKPKFKLSHLKEAACIGIPAYLLLLVLATIMMSLVAFSMIDLLDGFDQTFSFFSLMDGLSLKMFNPVLFLSILSNNSLHLSIDQYENIMNFSVGLIFFQLGIFGVMTLTLFLYKLISKKNELSNVVLFASSLIIGILQTLLSFIFTITIDSSFFSAKISSGVFHNLIILPIIVWIYQWLACKILKIKITPIVSTFSKTLNKSFGDSSSPVRFVKEHHLCFKYFGLIAMMNFVNLVTPQLFSLKGNTSGILGTLMMMIMGILNALVYSILRVFSIPLILQSGNETLSISGIKTMNGDIRFGFILIGVISTILLIGSLYHLFRKQAHEETKVYFMRAGKFAGIAAIICFVFALLSRSTVRFDAEATFMSDANVSMSIGNPLLFSILLPIVWIMGISAVAYYLGAFIEPVLARIRKVTVIMNRFVWISGILLVLTLILSLPMLNNESSNSTRSSHQDTDYFDNYSEDSSYDDENASTDASGKSRVNREFIQSGEFFIASSNQLLKATEKGVYTIDLDKKTIQKVDSMNETKWFTFGKTCYAIQNGSKTNFYDLKGEKINQKSIELNGSLSFSFDGQYVYNVDDGFIYDLNGKEQGAIDSDYEFIALTEGHTAIVSDDEGQLLSYDFKSNETKVICDAYNEYYVTISDVFYSTTTDSTIYSVVAGESTTLPQLYEFSTQHDFYYDSSKGAIYSLSNHELLLKMPNYVSLTVDTISGSALCYMDDKCYFWNADEKILRDLSVELLGVKIND